MDKFERYEELTEELRFLELEYKRFVKEHIKKMDILVSELDKKCTNHHARVGEIRREMRRLEYDGRNKKD